MKEIDKHKDVYVFIDFLSAGDEPEFIYWLIMKVLHMHPSDLIISTK